MDLPEYAKKQIVSRIVEMDFISRVFIKNHFSNQTTKMFTTICSKKFKISLKNMDMTLKTFRK